MLLIFLQCQREEDYTPASFSHAALCIVIVVSVLGISSNGLLLLGIYKSKAYHSKFYAIIINIIISDSMMVSIIAPSSIYLASEYSKNTLLVIARNYQFLFMFFIFTVAITGVLNLAFLNMDRYIFLRNPEIYSSTLNKKKHFSGIVILWVISFVLSALQKVMELQIFILLYSIIILMSSGVVMVIVLYAYWHHFNHKNSQKIKRIHSSHNTQRNAHITASPKILTNLRVMSIPDYLNSTVHETRKPSDTPSVATIPGTPEDFLDNHVTKWKIRENVTALETQKRKKRRFLAGKTVYESRIVLTLAIMTGVYWLNYIPVIIGGFFLLFCPECECDVKDTIGTIIACAFMIGSFLRPLVFLLRFSQPKDAICNLFDRRRRREQTYKHERDPYS